MRLQCKYCEWTCRSEASMKVHQERLHEAQIARESNLARAWGKGGRSLVALKANSDSSPPAQLQEEARASSPGQRRVAPEGRRNWGVLTPLGLGGYCPFEFGLLCGRNCSTLDECNRPAWVVKGIRELQPPAASRGGLALPAPVLYNRGQEVDL